MFYKNHGNLELALENYISALRIQESNHFVSATAFSLCNIGTVYSLKGDLNKALAYFKKANDIFVSLNLSTRVIGTQNNIGNVYEAKGELNRALYYYEQSLKLYDELEDKRLVFAAFNNIGNVYFQRNNIGLALTYYNKALALEKENGNLNGQANALHNIGSCFRAVKEYDQAVTYFNEALEIVQTTENSRLLSIIYKSLAEVNFEQNNMFMAYSFLSLHATAKETMISEESNKRIASLETAYEFDKKEAEIKALKIESDLQQLQLQNNKIIIAFIILISIVGITSTFIIYRENRVIKKNEIQLERQKNVLKDKNQIIEEKNLNITESIDYAKSVQQSLLSYSVSKEQKDRMFVFYKPKDIVSGDFYWYSNNDLVDIIAVADCTGHGVAGALLTVVGMTALDNIINKENVASPSEILKRLNQQVNIVLKRSDGEHFDHGLDIAICKIDHQQKKVSFAGANRPLFYFSSGGLAQIKGSRVNIGQSYDKNLDFDEQTIEYNEGDMFYLTTDGYTDQFGGGEDKKFMYVQFREMLENIHTKSLEEQHQYVQKTIDQWQGETVQTDDILVIGFKP